MVPAVFIPFILRLASAGQLCPDDFQGDLRCDGGCMTAFHSFDTGAQPQSDCTDACNLHCSASLLYNSVCDSDCNTWDCQWDGGNCLYCAEGCLVATLGDGVCEEACNTGECVWDFGDCSTEVNPPQIYVGTAGGQGNGSLKNPFTDISKLLWELFLPFNHVFILEGTYILSSSAVSSPTLLSQRSLVSTLITGSEPVWPSIRLARNFTSFHISHRVTFSNLRFDGSFDLREGCWAPTCLYCPFIAFDINTEEWVNDRGELIDISQYATQSFCNEYQDKVFISVTVEGELTLTNSSFSNFNQQLKALLAIECGDVHLKNVTFEKCMAAPTGSTGGLIQQICPPANVPYDCGELTYEGGSVAYLNDGYEYRPDIVLAGFMYIGGIRLLTLSNVTFSYNNVMVGQDAGIDSSTIISLISIANFRQMEVSYCLFDHSLAYSSATIHVSADFLFPLRVVDGVASEQLLDHLIIRDSAFHANTALNGAILRLTYSGDHQNIRFARLNFTRNVCLTSLIDIENESIDKDDWRGWVATIAGENVTFPSRSVELIAISAEANQCARVLALKNIGNLYVSGSNFDYNGESSTATLEFSILFASFAEHEFTYLTQIPQMSVPLQCSEIVSLTNVMNLTYVNTDMEGNYCPNGVSGVSLSGIVDEIDIHSDSFAHGNGAGALTLAVSEPVELSGLHCWNNTNVSSKNSVCLDLRMQAPTDVVIRDSVFESNNGWFSTVVYASKILSLTLDRVLLISNNAKYTCAGVLFNPIPSGLSRLVVRNSEFVGNKANTYGVVTVIDYDGLLAGNSIGKVDIRIQNSTFRDNYSGNLGASVSLGSSIGISQDSSISNCTFTNNQCEKGAGIFAQFQSGVLTIDFSLFVGNKSPSGGAMFLSHFPTITTPSAVYIRNCVFLNQTFGPAVDIQGYSQNTNVFGNNNLFSGGEGGYFISAGTLVEESSVFTGIVKTEGPAVFAQTRSILMFRNVAAVNNIATSCGGAVFLTSHSNLTLEASRLSNNIASESGGAVFVDENSIAEMRNSVFEFNQAGIASVLYASPADVIIYNCTFSHNFVSNYGCILLTHCLSSIAFSTFSNNTSNGNCPGIIISACVVSVSDTEMTDQRGRNGVFIQGIDHNSIAIIRTSFRRGYASVQGGAVFATLQSSLNITSSLFEDCVAAQEGGAISIQSSDLTIIQSSFLRTRSYINGGAVTMREGKLRVEDSHFSEISPGMGYIFGAEEVNISNSVFTNSTSSTGGALTLKNIPLAYLISNTFEDNTAEISAGGLFLVSDGSQSTRNQFFVSGNEFRGNHASKTDGGGVMVSDVDLVMDGNKLEGNAAEGKGGALVVTCAIWDWCNITITNNEFRGNSAGIQGGAIAWSGAYPRFNGNTYFDNSASYGFNVASFPIQLSLVSPNSSAVPYLSMNNGVPVALKLYNIASGQAYSLPITLGLFDHRGILLTTDVRSGAKLAPWNSSVVSVSGNIDTEAIGGTFTFQDFVLTGDPGTTQFLVVITDGVDLKMHAKVRDEAEYYDRVAIEVQFRMCVSGESEEYNMCFLCNSGTYSLDPSLPCLLCPSQAVCYGNNTMVPKPGFWRISNDTDKFIECLAPEACIGSPDPPFLSLIGLCATGYSGNLCQQCVHDYSRTGRFLCNHCPSRASNVTLTSLVVILALTLVALIVWTAIKGAMRPQSLIAIYVKIFMNYLQMVVVSASLDLNWPAFAKAFLNGQQMAGGMAEQLFSFDCIVQDVSLSTTHLYFTKVLLYSLFPLILLALAVITWGALVVCIKIESILRKLVASAVIILFILHPSITKMMFSMFACMDLGDDKLWLINDLSIVCWNSDHIKQILMVVVPTMLVFVFGLPLFALLILVVKRTALDTWSLKLMLCFLYKGYTRERFYWEFVILYRKVAMIAASVFLAPISIRIQALTVLALLLCSLFLQVQVHPFFDPSLNRLEVKAILVSALTIYSGLYYDTNELGSWVKVSLFGAVIVANAYFLVSWMRMVWPVLLRTIKDRFISILRWRKSYRIEAMNSGKSSEIQEKPSLPNFSIDVTNIHCSGIDAIPEVEVSPESYQNPANTSVVMSREYTEQEEVKEHVHYTLVE